MKTTIFILCLVCAVSAVAQNGAVLSGQPQPIRMCENPQHATQHDLATEQSLLAQPAYHYERGERPLWEFGPVSQPVPLGDVARAYRTQHTLAKKAEVSLEKQNQPGHSCLRA